MPNVNSDEKKEPQFLTVAPVVFNCGSRCFLRINYTIPCAIIASATFKKPAMFAPAT